MGDKNTFGKGTVQTILEIGRFTSLLGSRSQEDGALKLTIQKFYRVAGGSTQLHGVASDIVLPSLSDLPEFGEGALKNALPYDEVPKARFTKWAEQPQIFRRGIEAPLRRCGCKRTRNSITSWKTWNGCASGWMRTAFRLNEDMRRAELNEDKMRKEMRAKERLARQAER